MRGLWRRAVILGFRLLYNELAWTYDLVSWVVSLGRWRDWQRSVGTYLPPAGRVLEVGFGPGHLLAELAKDGFQAVGLDLSPAMLRLAQRNLGRRGRPVPLCRGQAQALPFARHSFDAVVLTFPTPFVYDPAWIDGLVRVLREKGRLVVVEMARFAQHSPHIRLLEALYRVTGQRGSTPHLPGLLAAAGLEAWRERVEVRGTQVSLVLADKPAANTQNR